MFLPYKDPDADAQQEKKTRARGLICPTTKRVWSLDNGYLRLPNLIYCAKRQMMSETQHIEKRIDR